VVLRRRTALGRTTRERFPSDMNFFNVDSANCMKYMTRCWDKGSSGLSPAVRVVSELLLFLLLLLLLPPSAGAQVRYW